MPMHVVASLILAAAMLAGCGIAAPMTPQACPAALLTGVLAVQDDDLVVVPDVGGRAEHIEWPAGYAVRATDAGLAVVDPSGAVKARPGDVVQLGGGERQDGWWVVCGQFDVGPLPPG